MTPSGIKLHEMCMKMGGVKLGYPHMVVLLHWRCPRPLEGSAQADCCGTGPVGDLCLSGDATEGCPRASQVASAALSG